MIHSINTLNCFQCLKPWSILTLNTKPPRKEFACRNSKKHPEWIVYSLEPDNSPKSLLITITYNKSFYYNYKENGCIYTINSCSLEPDIIFKLPYDTLFTQSLEQLRNLAKRYQDLIIFL